MTYDTTLIKLDSILKNGLIYINKEDTQRCGHTRYAYSDNTNTEKANYTITSDSLKVVIDNAFFMIKEDNKTKEKSK